METAELANEMIILVVRDDGACFDEPMLGLVDCKENVSSFI